MVLQLDGGYQISNWQATKAWAAIKGNSNGGNVDFSTTVKQLKEVNQLINDKSERGVEFRKELKEYLDKGVLVVKKDKFRSSKLGKLCQRIKSAFVGFNVTRRNEKLKYSSKAFAGKKDSIEREKQELRLNWGSCRHSGSKFDIDNYSSILETCKNGYEKLQNSGSTEEDKITAYGDDIGKLEEAMKKTLALVQEGDQLPKEASLTKLKEQKTKIHAAYNEVSFQISNITGRYGTLDPAMYQALVSPPNG